MHSTSYSQLHFSPNFRIFISNINKVQVPRTILEAFQHPKWKEAILEEMKVLKKNGTWEITKLTPEKHLVGYKWVFTVKYKEDGRIDRFKACLVAKGFT